MERMFKVRINGDLRATPPRAGDCVERCDRRKFMTMDVVVDLLRDSGDADS
jgi:hypothetical protein